MSKFPIKYKVISIVTCAAIALLGIYVAHWELRKPEFEVHFFHLNKGRSVFIRTPHNKTILIDGGQSGDIIAELTGIFPFYRRYIDTIIMTSATPKNVGGLVEVGERFGIGEVVEPSVLGTSTAFTAFQRIIREKEVKLRDMERGDEFAIDGVKFKVIFDMAEMVLQVEYASTSMLLLGDISKTIQKSLVSDLGKVNLVEFAHGASDSRVSSELFKTTDPDFIVYSKKDSTRAPSKTKKKFDIDVVDTSRLVNLEKRGSVGFISDGRELLPS
jgi:competence protein ComEC